MAEEETDAETNGSGNGRSVLDALMSKEVVVPAALSAVAALAAAKAPDMVRRLSDTAEQKGEESAERLGEKAAEGAKSSITGNGGMLGGIASKVLPGGGGGGGGNGGGGSKKKTRRLPIQRWTDVAVPVETAYDEWTNFEEYPKFMHRVLSVQSDDGDENKVRWQEKIWFSKRQWEGCVTDERKNDRIAWKTVSGSSHHGVVTFHRLDDNLTRVMVDMEFEPTGMIEKMASGLRFVKRAVQADLARFKAYVEMKDAEGIDYGPAKQSENGDKSDEERESGRRERENSRRERRESAGAST